jgi:hypothetical protein
MYIYIHVICIQGIAEQRRQWPSYMYVSMYIFIYTYIYICIYISRQNKGDSGLSISYMYVSTYIYIYVHIFMYIYISRQNKGDSGLSISTLKRAAPQPPPAVPTPKRQMPAKRGTCMYVYVCMYVCVYIYIDGKLCRLM